VIGEGKAGEETVADPIKDQLVLGAAMKRFLLHSREVHLMITDRLILKGALDVTPDEAEVIRRVWGNGTISSSGTQDTEEGAGK
jgi:hypothetical protein